MKFCDFPYCSLFEMLYFVTRLRGQVTEQEVFCVKGENWFRSLCLSRKGKECIK